MSLVISGLITHGLVQKGLVVPGTVDVEVGIITAPPNLTGLFDLQDGEYNENYYLNLNTLNTGGRATSWSWNGTPPPWANLDTSSGIITGTATIGNWSGYSVTASNIWGDADTPGSSTSNTDSVAIIAPTAPDLTGVFDLLDSEEGTSYNYDLNTLNTGGTVETWTWNGVPPTWANLDANTGIITGVSTPGTWSGYSVTATNITNTSTSNTDSVAISETPTMPIFSGVFDIIDGVQGESYSYDVSGLFSTGGTPSSYEFVGSYPSWASVDNTGLITGIATKGTWTGYSIKGINSQGEAISNTDSVFIDDNIFASQDFYAAYPALTDVQDVQNEGNIMNLMPKGVITATSVHSTPILAPDKDGIYREYPIDAPVWKGGRVEYADKVTNGDLSDGLTGWLPGTASSASINVNANNQLEILSGVGENGGAFGTAPSIIGNEYLIEFEVISCDNIAQARIGSSNTPDAGSVSNVLGSGEVVLGLNTVSWVGISNDAYMYFGGRDDVNSLIIDNFTMIDISAGVQTTYYDDLPNVYLQANEAATSKLPWSNDFNDAVWITVGNPIAIANSGISPTAVNDAQLVIFALGETYYQFQVPFSSPKIGFRAWVKLAPTNAATHILLTVIDNDIGWGEGFTTKLALTSEWQLLYVSELPLAGWGNNIRGAIGGRTFDNILDADCVGDLLIWNFEAIDTIESIISIPPIPTTTAAASIPKLEYTFPAANIDPADSLIEFDIDYQGDDTSVLTIGSTQLLEIGNFAGLGDGAELIINGTFDTDTAGWTPLSSPILSVTGGVVRIEFNGSNHPKLYQAFTTEVGKSYSFSADAVNSQGLANDIRIGTSQASGDIYTAILADNSSNTAVFVATATTTYVTLVAFGASAVAGDFSEFDNISIKEVSNPTKAIKLYDGVNSLTLPIVLGNNRVAVDLNSITGLMSLTVGGSSASTNYVPILSGLITVEEDILALRSAPSAQTISPPVASGTFNPPDGVVGDAYSYQTSSLFTGIVDSYSLNGILPDGLGFNSVTGEISGTPTTVEVLSNIAITANNTAGSATTNIADIEISPALDPPIASGTFAPPDGQESVAYSYDTSVLFTGGVVDSYAVNGTLPDGLAFNTSTGIIDGTPTTSGTSGDISITGTNSYGSASTNLNTITIVVGANPPIASGTFIPPDGEETVLYSYDTSSLFTGGAVVSYALVGVLPAGLTLNTSTGVIEGTPTTAGTSGNISITGTNVDGSDTTNTDTITIAAQVTNEIIDQPLDFQTTWTIDGSGIVITGPDSVTGTNSSHGLRWPTLLVVGDTYTVSGNWTNVSGSFKVTEADVDSAFNRTIILSAGDAPNTFVAGRESILFRCENTNSEATNVTLSVIKEP